ncbi:uncharacterized protein LTR77_003523 [Saxophila tyrrhenica]|uniref:Uncharacterized protein n=1 Tax=Saxophila tyrrhenica TaxID=1690608 RepID=A0AAV9PHA9_9PEZI|nr:hypothetical protein LTR77_003523 [Saxophila tyrrhenica]
MSDSMQRSSQKVAGTGISDLVEENMNDLMDHATAMFDTLDLAKSLTNDPADTPAACAAFNTFELVEQFMLRLSRKDVIRLTRPARIWYNVIRESPSVRELHGPAAPLDKTAPWVNKRFEVKNCHDDSGRLLYDLNVRVPVFPCFPQYDCTHFIVNKNGMAGAQHHIIIQHLSDNKKAH